jgi:hypothetical protein
MTFWSWLLVALALLLLAAWVRHASDEHRDRSGGGTGGG